MNLETPLSEVVAYLPREAAVLLEFQPVIRQTAILTAVRRVLVEWEECHVTIEDPVAFAVVLTSFVKELLGLYISLLNHLQMHQIDPSSWEAGR